jgi:hypothetical protein
MQAPTIDNDRPWPHTTRDQRFYEVNGQIKAEIDICPTAEHSPAPIIHHCRHAVLPLNKGKGYVVYDRRLQRIVNGVYYNLKTALACAQDYNDRDTAPQDMAPNGAALGLIYPERT